MTGRVGGAVAAYTSVYTGKEGPGKRQRLAGKRSGRRQRRFEVPSSPVRAIPEKSQPYQNGGGRGRWKQEA